MSTPINSYTSVQTINELQNRRDHTFSSLEVTEPLAPCNAKEEAISDERSRTIDTATATQSLLIAPPEQITTINTEERARLSPRVI